MGDLKEVGGLCAPNHERSSKCEREWEGKGQGREGGGSCRRSIARFPASFTGEMGGGVPTA